MSDKTSDILIIYSSSFKLKEVNVLKKKLNMPKQLKNKKYITLALHLFSQQN